MRQAEKYAKGYRMRKWAACIIDSPSIHAQETQKYKETIYKIHRGAVFTDDYAEVIVDSTGL